MDSEQKAHEGHSCCTKGYCCGGKAVAALVLLLVGGMIGHCIGRRCGLRECPVGMMNPAVQAQAK